MVDHARAPARRDDHLDHVHPPSARPGARGQRAGRRDPAHEVRSAHAHGGPEALARTAGLDLDHDEAVLRATYEVQLAAGEEQPASDRAQARARQVPRREPLAGTPAPLPRQAPERPAGQHPGEEQDGARFQVRAQPSQPRDEVRAQRQGAGPER